MNGLLTFSLDLEYADGIFWAEGAKLAGRQRVAAALWYRGAHMERSQERQCAHHRHFVLFERFSGKASDNELSLWLYGAL